MRKIISFISILFFAVLVYASPPPPVQEDNVLLPVYAQDSQAYGFSIAVPVVNQVVDESGFTFYALDVANTQLQTIKPFALVPEVTCRDCEVFYANQLPAADNHLLASLGIMPDYEDNPGAVEEVPGNKSMISKIYAYCEKNWGVLASILFLLSELLASSKLKSNSIFQLLTGWLKKKATYLKE